MAWNVCFEQFDRDSKIGECCILPPDKINHLCFSTWRQLQQKLDIALVVSVGSGIYPVEDLGKTDAQEFLYFGKHWLKAGHAIKARAKSLVTLLTTAVRWYLQCCYIHYSETLILAKSNLLVVFIPEACVFLLLVTVGGVRICGKKFQ